MTRVFAGGMSTAKARIEAIDSFQKSDTKACLLDIKVAARGLSVALFATATFRLADDIGTWSWPIE